MPAPPQFTDTRQFMDAVAPALLVAQAIARIGNYFNQELFGGPTSLPWGLQVAPQFRPRGYQAYTTFHPTFPYELIFDLALAAALVWLGHHRRISPRTCSPSTSPDIRHSGSSRNPCGWTPPSTSWGCA